MNRFEVKKLLGWSLSLAISISVATANGQYYEDYQPGPPFDGSRRQPLHQLPPIVAAEQQVPGQSMLQPVKQLYLPPIVSTQQPQSSDEPVNPVNEPVTKGRYSAAGIPLYPDEQQAAQNQNYLSLPAGNPVGQAGFLQGSGSRTLPPIITPDNTLAPSLPIQDFSNSIAPGNMPAAQNVQSNAPVTVVESGPFSAPGSTGAPGSNNFFTQPELANQNNGSFNIDNAGCTSCGPNGCYDLDTVHSQFGCCGSVVSAGYYLFAEGLIWTRGDGEVQLSNFFGLDQFDTDGGLRITLGYRQNATRGREFTYFGTTDITEERTFTSANNQLNATFVGVGGIGFQQTSSFFNAFSQTQRKSTQLQSLEYNRINWSWDLLKTILGVRYIYFDDSYSFFSSNNFSNGLFVQDAVNNLFGVHGGMELFYDVGYRTSVSGTAKFAGLINAANVDTNLFNAGVQSLAQDVDDSSFAGTIELGFMSHIQLNPRARFRVGYDLFFLWGAFTVANNIPRDTFSNGNLVGTPVISPNTGTDLNTNNPAVFFNGLSLGFEVFR